MPSSASRGAPQRGERGLLADVDRARVRDAAVVQRLDELVVERDHERPRAGTDGRLAVAQLLDEAVQLARPVAPGTAGGRGTRRHRPSPRSSSGSPWTVASPATWGGRRGRAGSGAALDAWTWSPNTSSAGGGGGRAAVSIMVRFLGGGRGRPRAGAWEAATGASAEGSGKGTRQAGRSRT